MNAEDFLEASASPAATVILGDAASRAPRTETAVDLLAIRRARFVAELYRSYQIFGMMTRPASNFSPLTLGVGEPNRRVSHEVRLLALYPLTLTIEGAGALFASAGTVFAAGGIGRKTFF